MKEHTNRKLNKELKIGLFLISLFVIWAIAWTVYSNFIAGSISSPYLPIATISNELLSPSSLFPLGTDIYGRSLLEVISEGLIYSLTLAIIVSFIAAAIGIIIGYITAEGRGFLKYFCDLSTNLIFIFPSILIAIMVMSVVGQSMSGLIVTMIFTGWPSYAKVARGEAQRVLSLSYVESARAVGVSETRLFLKTVLPSILPVLIVNFVLGISGVIVSEATLGFLGLGGSEYSWGNLLSMGKTVLLEAPYIVVFLSVILGTLIIGLNLLGDGLRDFIDPRKSS
ncbi:ABC transporter, permease protein [Bacteriovorax sp. BSW11_IV]|uniref:ABC transporter permease n=1 Tax=Bacteriovorax sp. BSW11_IV TaxID=1353529 RepID=UPI000389FCAE|nr:ABC transporter permease [Bacteriovorax sp. BSW11_IV]EQC46303.1 ABC transporter, permease protein [Bacteriovorax sp. BSW11_IV]